MKRVISLLVVLAVLMLVGCKEQVPPNPGDINVPPVGKIWGALPTGFSTLASNNYVLNPTSLNLELVTTADLTYTLKNYKYIWKTFYILGLDTSGGRVWKPYTFDADPVAGTNWIKVANTNTGVTKTISISQNDFPSSNTYLVVYACNKTTAGTFNCANPPAAANPVGTWRAVQFNITTTNLGVETLGNTNATTSNYFDVPVNITNSNINALMTTSFVNLSIDFAYGEDAARVIDSVKINNGPDLLTQLDPVKKNKLKIGIPKAELATDKLQKVFNVRYSSAGDHIVNVNIDTAKEVTESNENDNEREFMLVVNPGGGGTSQIPDFSVAGISIGTGAANSITRINITYHRSGSYVYNENVPVWVQLYYSNTYPSSVTLEGISSPLDTVGSGWYGYIANFGANRDVNLTYLVNFSYPADYTVRAHINVYRAIISGVPYSVIEREPAATPANNDVTFTDKVEVLPLVTAPS
jgi:hypothetical protein